MYAVGDQFTFDDIFWQDFSRWRSIMPGVTFTLESFTHNEHYAWLRAPGYGIIGNYGNGAIQVSVSELDKATTYQPAPDLLAAYRA